jgi:four helix bundle protein
VYDKGDYDKEGDKGVRQGCTTKRATRVYDKGDGKRDDKVDDNGSERRRDGGGRGRAAFDHERLSAYRLAVDLAVELEAIARSWKAGYAIKDHLVRAMEGTVVCMAEASAAVAAVRARFLVSAMGSVAECAACMDIATIGGLMESAAARQRKGRLRALFAALVRMRSPATMNRVCEEGVEYGTQGWVFRHESLDVYQRSLDVIRWMARVLPGPLPVSSRSGALDAAATGVVLNLAEGNVRFSRVDQVRFWGIARQSAVKMSALMDLCISAGSLDATDAAEVKPVLVRIVEMIEAFRRSIRPCRGFGR